MAHVGAHRAVALFSACLSPMAAIRYLLGSVLLSGLAPDPKKKRFNVAHFFDNNPWLCS
jgi:hypothetical protein